jgi:hypothetical protein
MGSYNIPDKLVVRISKLGEEPVAFILKSVSQAIEIAERNANQKEVK